jgi:6-phosphogluconolactonase
LNVFSWDASAGSLKPVQVPSTVTPGPVTDNPSAEIEVSPNGRFLYESNRRVSAKALADRTVSASTQSTRRKAL